MDIVVRGEQRVVHIFEHSNHVDISSMDSRYVTPHGGPQVGDKLAAVAAIQPAWWMIGNLGVF